MRAARGGSPRAAAEQRGRRALGRLYLILGGLIVLVLLTIFVAPFFIDWNGFRATFEQRASEVVGQPVRIVGNIDLTMLPSPTVTLAAIEVGDTEGAPMATIEQLSLKLELLPLLAGQFNVIELVLDRPVVNAAVDDTGTLDWMIRADGADGLDPDRVTLNEIVVNDGSLSFYDARSGGAFALTQINTNLFEASSLNGPWRIDGSLICSAELICGDALPVTFRLATGRLAADGSMRVTTEITPASAELAGTLRSEGTVRRQDGLLAYEGTFGFDKLNVLAEGVPASDEGGLLASAWTIAGGFRLVADLLTLSGATWESGDGLVAVTGDATLTLGEGAAFDATLVSRQINLDQAFGEGEAASVADAASELWRRLANALPPAIPGRFSLQIPSMILSGSVLQELLLQARAEGAAWQVETLELALPGQSRLALGGRLEPGEAPTFDGTVALSSALPTVLAGWLGAGSGDPALQPFAFAADIAATSATVAFTDASLAIGGNELAGAVTWRADEAGPAVAADLSTQSFAYEQLQAIAGLLRIGGDAPAEGALPRYQLRFAAGEIHAGGATAGDVLVDVAFAGGELAIGEFRIGDLDGAEVTIAGDLAGLNRNRPVGTLAVTLDAGRLDGVTALAREFAAEPGLVAWLEDAAPYLAPLHLEGVMTTETTAGFAYQIALEGLAGATEFRAVIDTDGLTEDWRAARAALEIEIDAADGAELARQAGLPDPVIEDAGPATLDLNATGVPADGMAVQLQATLAGALVAAEGRLTVVEGEDTAFAGPIAINGDLDPLAALLGITLPNPGVAKPAVLDGTIDLAGDTVGVVLSPSSVLQQSVEGELRLARTGAVWTLQGTLDLDEVDLGWLTNLQLGAAVLPRADPAAPWSREPLVGPLWDGFAVAVDLTVDRLIVGANLTVTNADLGFAFSPAGARIDLRNGSLSSGLVRSTIALTFDGGQVDLDGQLFLFDVPLETLVWRSGTQPVAEGVISFSSVFASSGRSMAGLISSLTGSGSLEIRQGVFHFLGADAFNLVIRLADEGEGMTEEALREAFTGFLDAGTLAFGDGTIAFDIAAGIVTPRPIIKEVGDVRVVARSPIDLTRLQIDSSWELTLVQGRGLGDGLQPRVFVTFTGPLASPERQVNVAPLAGYLSLRRLQETDRLQAEVLERERFIRMIERMEADREAAAEGAPADPEPAEEPAPPPLLIPGGI